MIKAGTGKSQNEDAFKAGAEAAKIAMDKAKGNADLIIVFSSIRYDQKQMLSGVRSVTKEILLAGSSTAGEISNEGVFSKSVVVMALKADEIKFTISAETKINANSQKAGKDLAKAIHDKAKDPLSLLMVFSDGMTENGVFLLRGIQEVLGVSFPIIGGSSGDDLLFKKTYQYCNDQVLTDAAVGIGFSGSFFWGTGVMHGWDPVGLPMKITKAKGRVLKKLDNNPAIKIYEDYFGQKAKELANGPLSRIAYTYPLGLAVKGSTDFLLRNVISVDSGGEITCSGDVEDSSVVRLMIGSQENAIKAAEAAARATLLRVKGAEVKTIFVFDCAARNKFLGSRNEEEITVIKDVLGKNVPLIGFYAYGGQASLGGRICKQRICRAEFHNESVVIFALGE